MVSQLPRDVYVLQAGLVLNAFGNGAAAPFMVIYLHDGRGFSLGVAGAVSSTGAVSALLVGLAAGAFGDRLGAKPTMLAGLLLSTAAYLVYPLVREPWQAFGAAVLAGAGIGTWLAMQSSLLAAITPAELRHKAFAQQRVAANLGLGLGGFAGGTLVTASRPSSFTALFLLNAATFVIYMAFVRGIRVDRPVASRPRGIGYRAVVGDGTFVRLAALNFAFVAGAVALLASMLPVYARNFGGLGERTIGALFLLNSFLIVVCQLPVARLHEGHRRMPTLALMSCCFAGCWLLAVGAGNVGVGWATALLATGVVVFALGECLYDTVYGPLVADLAPAELTSRYMAFSGFAWQLGFIAGPGLGGLILGATGSGFWVVPAVVCLAAGIGALRLESRLPEAVRRTPSGASAVRSLPQAAPARGPARG